MGGLFIGPSDLGHGRRESTSSCEQPRAAIRSHEKPRAAARKRCFTARGQGDVRPAMRYEQPRVARPIGVAPSGARSIEQLRITASIQEQPRAARPKTRQRGAAARSEALPRGSERKEAHEEAPLSQESHARGFSSVNKGQLWRDCVAAAPARAVQR
jgi:hypothetical protein